MLGRIAYVKIIFALTTVSVLGSCQDFCLSNCTKQFQNTSFHLEFPKDWEQGWTIGKHGYFFRKIDYSMGFGRVELPPMPHFIITVQDSLEHNLAASSDYVKNFIKVDSTFLHERHISNRSTRYKDYKAQEYVYHACYAYEHTVKIKSIVFNRENNGYHFCLFALEEDYESAIEDSQIILDSFEFK